MPSVTPSGPANGCSSPTSPPGDSVTCQGDILVQTESLLEGLKGVLEAEGGSLRDVVRVTVHVTEMDKFMEVHQMRHRPPGPVALPDRKHRLHPHHNVLLTGQDRRRYRRRCCCYGPLRGESGLVCAVLKGAHLGDELQVTQRCARLLR